MNFDTNQIQQVVATLVALGGIASPAVFYIINILKQFIPSQYLKIAAIILGGILGAVVVAIGPALGILGLNYAVGIVAGLIGGYLATNQFDNAAQQGIAKIESKEDETVK